MKAKSFSPNFFLNYGTIIFDNHTKLRATKKKSKEQHLCKYLKPFQTNKMGKGKTLPYQEKTKRENPNPNDKRIFGDDQHIHIKRTKTSI